VIATGLYLAFHPGAWHVHHRCRKSLSGMARLERAASLTGHTCLLVSSSSSCSRGCSSTMVSPSTP
jgi:hypothetical protein